MVRVLSRDGTHHSEGITLLRRMILSRGLPYSHAMKNRIRQLLTIFDQPETCDRLCQVSGGHVRNLLVMLYGCLQKQDPPIERDTLEDVILTQRDSMIRAIDTHEWKLLHNVKDKKAVVGEAEYQTLLKSLFVFEYRDEKGTWFGLNPILAEAEQFQ